MNISFLDGLLIFIIINLALIYIYQSLEERCNNNDHDGICKYFSNKIKNNNHNNKFISISNYNINKDIVSLPKQLHHQNNKLRLLANYKGPAIGFHQSFKTHIPELGWRDFYLRLNGGISGVNTLNYPNNNNIDSHNKNDLPFTNIITKNYLDQLESTDNIYSIVDY